MSKDFWLSCGQRLPDRNAIIGVVGGHSAGDFCYKRPMTGPMRIIGLAGWSGSGKTTLVTKALPRLIARGQRVSTIKHAHHGFDLDQPGKDSFMHRTAGATEVLISSARRFAILHELRDDAEWDLPELLAKLSPVDLVLVEGFKRDAFPKLEIHRAANGKPLLQPDDPHIVAIACDTPLPEAKVPVIDLNDIERIVDMLLKQAVPLQSVAAAMRSA
jgi:molybdopterin-guanine dinucleotide biosynthesis protein B